MPFDPGVQMLLSKEKKRQYQKIGHHLNSIVTLSSSGLTQGVLLETKRALLDHELIKIKINLPDRTERLAVLETLCQQTQSELIQSIGKVGLLFKKSKERNEQLSNLVLR